MCVNVAHDGYHECRCNDVQEIPPKRFEKRNDLPDQRKSGASKRSQLNATSSATKKAMSDSNIVGFRRAATVSNTPMKYGYTFAGVVVPADLWSCRNLCAIKSRA